jgi:formylglycine-generating enzyme required for sulfatase activity
VERESQVVTNTLTVSRLKVDSTLCNTGNGQLAPVGSYPRGANPLGLEDLVGSVWQLTHDVYANGANTFHILKGGSYYLPASSWWYVEGGPRELTYSQKLMRIGPGFERNGTVGFRCVQDMAH